VDSYRLPSQIVFGDIRVNLTESPTEIVIRFPWSPSKAFTILKDFIKGMQGARFRPGDPPVWAVHNCPRNRWQFQIIDPEAPDPYLPYRGPLLQIEPNRDCLYGHQKYGLNFVMTRKRCILAAEMGTGKTLVLIEALEHAAEMHGIVDPWYIAPKFALHAIRNMFVDWKSQVMPRFLSYEQLVKIVANWDSGTPAPDFLIFDESAYIKTQKSQRTQYAMAMADGMRMDHEDREPFIVLASGAPAPHSPADWWAQTEVARPGFLKERDTHAFQRRYGLVKQYDSPVGGSYNKLETWWDNPSKCKHCGQKPDHLNHLPGTLGGHPWEASENEVAKLYERISGLVCIQFKRDCVDLPEKTYRTIVCPANPKTLLNAKHIVRTSCTTIEALTKLRELSDGFQYAQEAVDAMVACPICHGTGEAFNPDETNTCPKCEGLGQIHKVERIANRVPCPKDAALESLLEECEENGRIVIYAGFTASIDRIVELCIAKKWAVIRADGVARTAPGGIWTSVPMQDPLRAFQDKERLIQKIAFVAHPATAKTALTLTEAWMLVYYSNTFNGDDRIQSEDRIHRIGMDQNKGAVIVDLAHLPTDEYVLHNLKSKKRLQAITLGDFQTAAANAIDLAIQNPTRTSY